MGILSQASKKRVLALCVLVVCVGVALVFSGCMTSAKRPTTEGDMAETVIVQDDQGKTFEVRQGNTISIRLAENPTTGYEWELGAINEQIIELQDSDFSTPPETGIGGGGTRTLTFKAQSPGTVKIQLKLRREWEPEDAAIDRFEVTIRVRDDESP